MTSIRILFVFSSVMATVLFNTACTPEDNERCGDGFVFEDHTCVPIADSEPGACDITDTGDTEGNGQTCCTGGVDSPDCPAAASYCVMQPGQTSGYCTRSDCAVSPSDCVDGYTCCAFTITGDVFCAENSQYEMMSGAGMCEE